MVVPYGVSTCLYHGISQRIEFVSMILDEHLTCCESKLPIDLVERDYQGICEAMDFYKEHCVLSYAHLYKEFEPLREKYQKVKEMNKGGKDE